MAESSIHYCRWDWCSENFTSAEQLKQHVENHICCAVPMRKSDVQLVLRAEGSSIRTSMIWTPHSSFLAQKPDRVDAAVMTESIESVESQPPHPSPHPPPHAMPSASSSQSHWFTFSNGPLVTSTQFRPELTQHWQPQSQLHFDFGNSLTSVDPSQLSIYK